MYSQLAKFPGLLCLTFFCFDASALSGVEINMQRSREFSSVLAQFSALLTHAYILLSFYYNSDASAPSGVGSK